MPSTLNINSSNQKIKTLKTEIESENSTFFSFVTNIRDYVEIRWNTIQIFVVHIFCDYECWHAQWDNLYLSFLSPKSRLISPNNSFKEAVGIKSLGRHCISMPKRIFHYRVMPFGLKNVGSTYERVMQTIVEDMLCKESSVMWMAWWSNLRRDYIIYRISIKSSSNCECANWRRIQSNVHLASRLENF